MKFILESAKRDLAELEFVDRHNRFAVDEITNVLLQDNPRLNDGDILTEYLSERGKYKA